MLDPSLGRGLAGLAGAIVGVLITGTSQQFTRAQAIWPVLVCAGCGHRPTGATFIPVLGPLCTRGRCAHCATRSPWVLALGVQLLAAILGVLLFGRYGVTWLLAISAIDTAVLVAIGVVDLQHRLIPTLLVYPTTLLSLAVSPVWPNLGLLTSLIGAASAFGFFLGLALVARLAFGEGALGDGDVSLAGLIGAISGFPVAVVSLSLGAILGGIGATIAVVARRLSIGTTIPYGPFLAAGAIYVLLTGNTTQTVYGFM